MLVETHWVEDHLENSNVRIAEVDYDQKANYQLGHVRGSVLFAWKKDINDPISRNVLSKQACEDLLQKAGINNDTMLVLYGAFNNWFAAFAFWFVQVLILPATYANTILPTNISEPGFSVVGNSYCDTKCCQFSDRKYCTSHT